MNQAGEGLLKELYQLMEEEILQYHLLAEELKKESECLRQGSPDSLTESLHSLEIHTTAIRKAHGSIQSLIQKMLPLLNPQEEKKNLESLLALLPPEEGKRVRSYQKTLERLKKWSARINERNKLYLQESLSCWKDLVSLLTEPLADSPIYLQKGIKSTPVPLPYSLNRKV